MRKASCLLTLLCAAWPMNFAATADGVNNGVGAVGAAGISNGNAKSLPVIPVANDVTLNWQSAGLAVVGGIPTRNTQCGATVTTSGMTPPTPGDDYSKLVAAIAACPAGQVVQMGSGTFEYAQSELPIVVNKGITVRGNGTTVGTCDASTGTPCWSTVLQTYDGPQPTYNPTPQCGVTIGSVSNCPNGSGFFLVAPQGLFNFGWAGCAAAGTNVDPTVSNCGTLVAADVAKGGMTVQVADTSNFSVGMWTLIDESPQLVSTANPTGGANIQASAEFLNTTNSPVVMRVANPDGICTYTFCTDRVNQEIHLIAAIGAGPCPGAGCTVTFDSPLTMAFRQSGSHDARMYWPTLQTTNVANPFLQNVGIENLTLNRVNGGGIGFEFAAYGWVKNVEVNYWIGGAVNTWLSARIEITGSYMHNCIDCQNNGNEYPVGVSAASTEVLVDNNIITFGGKGMVGRAANSTVVAHNYVDKTFYETGAGIGDYWNDMSLNGSHYAGTHHFLFEGNWANNCDGDETHGNAIYHTFFRNNCTGARSAFVDPSNSLTVNDCAGIGYADPGNTPNSPYPLRAAGPMAFNYWYAFAGNVLGFSGMQSCAGGSFIYNGISGSTLTNRAMWISGWTGSEWPGFDANLTGVSHTFIFRNGNYDYVNTGIVDFASGFSHAFPNSLYRSTTPAYFGPGTTCTYPYPWIDSASGTPVKTSSCGGSGLPAKARYDAGTPFVQP